MESPTFIKYGYQNAPRGSVVRWLGLVAIVVATVACGSKRLAPASTLDTPENHYKQGLLKLAANNLQSAQAAFERARALDPDYPGTFVGIALVASEQGEYFRARQQIEEAIHRDNNFTDAYVARGRIATEEGMARGFDTGAWLKESLRAYRQAAKISPKDVAIYYYEGMSYLQSLDLDNALKSLTKVLEHNRGPYVARALHDVERIQMIQRASPGSDLGLKIAMVPEITRAELAVLLLEELKLAELVQQRAKIGNTSDFVTPEQFAEQSPETIADIQSNWAKAWIEEVLILGVQGLEVLPDGIFSPDAAITRANYARTNEGILVLISGDKSLTTRYVGESSRFLDVRGDSYAYNAIALNVDRGIMFADTVTGRFRPGDSVSGAEALVIIRQLQNVVRMEF